jgi:phage-related baseplate assembly protein
MANTTDVKYLGKDFTQLRTNLIEFTKNYFPNTYTDFNESSPGMLFLEMSSYVGDVLSFYTDKQIKESLLVTAEEKTNLYSLAQSLGYKVKNKIASSVDIDVFQLLPSVVSGSTVVPDWSYALTISSGMVVKSKSSNAEFRTLETVNFKTLENDPNANVSAYQINDVTNQIEYYLLKKSVKAVAGNIQTATYTFTDPKRFDRILLNTENIIEIVDVIDSDNNNWYEVPNLAQDTIFETIANVGQNDPVLSQYNTSVPYLLKLRKTARRFITRFRTDGTLEIQFGAGISADLDEEIIPNPDNVGSGLPSLQLMYDFPIDPSNFMYTKSYGLAPANTVLTVRYTTGGGIESNVPAFDLDQIIELNFDINEAGLNANLVNQLKASVACTNPNPASGGKDGESEDDVRNNTLAFFAAQSRAVTDQDYIIRAYSMPPKFGAISKAYVIQDVQVNQQTNQAVANPLALNLYTLGYNSDGTLTVLNNAVKENLKNYLTPYRMLTDAINITDAFIINFGIEFDIITLPEFNSNEVLIKCIDTLKQYFDIKKWQINQPIIISKIYTLLDRVDGVQTVPRVSINNIANKELGYSENIYPMSTQEGGSTRSGVIYPSMDPSIFEIKYPNNDIKGRVISL